jgi:hypothetical protein
MGLLYIALGIIFNPILQNQNTPERSIQRTTNKRPPELWKEKKKEGKKGKENSVR